MKHIKSFSEKIIRESNGSERVSLITPNDITGVIDVLYQAFGHIDSREEMEIKLRDRMLNGISLKLEIGGQIIGCYLLRERSVNDFIRDIEENKLKDFKSDNTQIYLPGNLSDNGLQGIALSVLPEWRSRGYGDLLKTWYDNNPRFDYIWGVQDKRLGNIDEWKKTREIFAECPTHFATIRFLKR